MIQDSCDRSNEMQRFRLDSCGDVMSGSEMPRSKAHAEEEKVTLLPQTVNEETSILP